MQPFEKHNELTESILFAAHNWKVNTGWTNHLEQINIICQQHSDLKDMLQKFINVAEDEMISSNNLCDTITEAEILLKKLNT